MFDPQRDSGYRELLPGIRQKTRAFGAKTLMAEFALARGSVLPLHAHPHEQAGYLISGHLRPAPEAARWSRSSVRACQGSIAGG
jgi:hypothetical protein